MIRVPASKNEEQSASVSRRAILLSLLGYTLAAVLSRTLRTHSWVDGMSTSVASERIAPWETWHLILGGFIAPFISLGGYAKLAKLALRVRHGSPSAVPQVLLALWIGTVALIGTLFLAVGMVVSIRAARRAEAFLFPAPFVLIGFALASAGITLVALRPRATPTDSNPVDRE